MAQKTLLVDDDISLLQALERAFHDAGNDVVACSTFSDARRVLREQPFDSVVTDIRLGEFNGLQLAVVARDVNPDVRLVVFSGFDDPVLRAEAERLGASYVVKPVSSKELMELLRRPQQPR